MIPIVRGPALSEMQRFQLDAIRLGLRSENWQAVEQALEQLIKEEREARNKRGEQENRDKAKRREAVAAEYEPALKRWAVRHLEPGMLVKFGGTVDGQGYREIIEVTTRTDDYPFVVAYKIRGTKIHKQGKPFRLDGCWQGDKFVTVREQMTENGLDKLQAFIVVEPGTTQARLVKVKPLVLSDVPPDYALMPLAEPSA